MENRSSSELERKLGLFPLTNIVIANMIGAGIFTTSGLLMSDLGNPLLMLALWVVGGIIALCGALAYGELGAAMPDAGGEYAFLSKLYHPLLGFLSGWTSFIVGFSAPIAASAIGFSEYFIRAYPQLFLWGDPAILKKILSICVILLFTGIHMRGIEFGARIQNVLTVSKVVLIACLIFGGLVARIRQCPSLLSRKHVLFLLRGMENTGPFFDVDYVCLQRMERLDLYRLGNSESNKKSSPIALLGDRRGDAALHLHQHRLRLRSTSGGNERRYLHWRIGHGKTLWPSCRDHFFSADLLRSFFLIECVHHSWPTDVLRHGEGSVIL